MFKGNCVVGHMSQELRERVLSIGTQFSNRVLTKLLTKLCGGTYVPRAERELSIGTQFSNLYTAVRTH